MSNPTATTRELTTSEIETITTAFTLTGDVVRSRAIAVKHAVVITGSVSAMRKQLIAASARVESGATYGYSLAAYSLAAYAGLSVSGDGEYGDWEKWRAIQSRVFVLGVKGVKAFLASDPSKDWDSFVSALSAYVPDVTPNKPRAARNAGGTSGATDATDAGESAGIPDSVSPVNAGAAQDELARRLASARDFAARYGNDVWTERAAELIAELSAMAAETEPATA